MMAIQGRCMGIFREYSGNKLPQRPGVGTSPSVVHVFLWDVNHVCGVDHDLAVDIPITCTTRSSFLSKKEEYHTMTCNREGGTLQGKHLTGRVAPDRGGHHLRVRLGHDKAICSTQQQEQWTPPGGVPTGIL